jgi:hypothetical protein
VVTVPERARRVLLAASALRSPTINRALSVALPASVRSLMQRLFATADDFAGSKPANSTGNPFCLQKLLRSREVGRRSLCCASFNVNTERHST